MIANSEPAFADLEIRILKREEAGYPVEITLDHDLHYERGFLSPTLPEEDGERLFAWLFADAALREAWEHARGQHPQRRIRLRLDLDVPELHALPWEALRDPESGLDLAAVDATPFSRYLAGTWQPGSPIATRPIKILVAIANPKNLGDYNLAALDEETEWAMLREVTEGLDVTLTRMSQPCTLNAIERGLRQGYHALHLIAHGAYSERRGHAALFLADAENNVKVVPEDDVSTMLARQLADGGGDAQAPGRLRLVFLASCESATHDTADAFRGVAPALVNAGVPAVVAMQDKVSITAARAFSHTFYENLLQHGRVDLAGNQARAALLTSGSREAATPVLFMRMRDGQLFEPLFEPGERDQQSIERQSFEPETVYIPAGPFLMGRPAGEGVPDEETPQHEVILPAYRIGKYPVTNAHYAEFLKHERAQEAPRKAGWFLREPPADKGDHPVVGVSWHDALAYCRWLSEVTGRSYRLPTEAEWEKAARGPVLSGAEGPVLSEAEGPVLSEAEGPSKRYPWGDVWEEGRCNAGGEDTTPVTAYPQGASPYGCWDMAGNVQEWVSTLWGSERQSFPYPYRDDDGREDLDADDYLYRVRRVHRGGSFRDEQSKLRCSARGHSSPGSKFRWRGFRVVLDV